MTVAYTPGSIFSLAQFHSQTLSPCRTGQCLWISEDLRMRSDTHEAAAISFYGDSPGEVLHSVQTSQGPLPHGSRTLSTALTCSPTLQCRHRQSSLLTLPRQLWPCHSSAGAQCFLCLAIRSTETSAHTPLLPFRC